MLHLQNLIVQKLRFQGKTKLNHDMFAGGYLAS